MAKTELVRESGINIDISMSDESRKGVLRLLRCYVMNTYCIKKLKTTTGISLVPILTTDMYF
jgi:hypothetical protein